MSFLRMKGALRVKDITPCQRVVLLWLADHENEGSYCCSPSVATLASEAYCSVRNILKNLRALRMKGLIDSARFSAGENNRYQFYFDAKGVKSSVPCRIDELRRKEVEAKGSGCELPSISGARQGRAGHDCRESPKGSGKGRQALPAVTKEDMLETFRGHRRKARPTYDDRTCASSIVDFLEVPENRKENSTLVFSQISSLVGARKLADAFEWILQQHKDKSKTEIAGLLVTNIAALHYCHGSSLRNMTKEGFISALEGVNLERSCQIKTTGVWNPSVHVEKGGK